MICRRHEKRAEIKALPQPKNRINYKLSIPSLSRRAGSVKGVKGVEVKISSKCVRCHRRLTNPASVTHGMGPVCWAKARIEREAEEEQGILPLLPFDGDIVCRRNETGEPQFNIPQRIKLHSPTGMEWGYGGSGPADFALNILALFTDEKTAYDLHQAFKWDFVAKLPVTGGAIKRTDILAWLANRGVKVVA